LIYTTRLLFSFRRAWRAHGGTIDGLMETAAGTGWRDFSLAERDFRWDAVRRHAAAAGLECVLLPPCVDGRNLHLSLESSRGARSDSRFLTLMDNAAVVLPVDGREPIVLNDDGAGNSWIPRARPGSRQPGESWGPELAAAIRELGLERARIGVSGAARGKYTHTRSAEGVIADTPYQQVLDALPNATFVDATDVVGQARYVKSEEQIACLRRGAEIAEAGVDELIHSARVGVEEPVLFARVMRRMLALGSEYYNLALVTGVLGTTAIRFIEPPLRRTLQPMQLINNEVDAVWGGLIAQEVQPVLLGPIPDDWRPVIDLHRDLFAVGLERMRPGTRFGELIEFVRGFGARRGMGSDILMHGRGYGNDGPLLTPTDRGETIHDVLVEEGAVFVFKPFASSADGSISFHWGGDVLITAGGGVPLFKREHGLVSVV
jgi:Xaa-Pro aminopeptidase